MRPGRRGGRQAGRSTEINAQWLTMVGKMMQTEIAALETANNQHLTHGESGPDYPFLCAIKVTTLGDGDVEVGT